MNKYCVYAHYLKGKDEPFYIGKGKGNRPFSKTRTGLWLVTVKDVEYNVRILQAGLSENEALCLEQSLIRKYGLLVDGSGILVNVIKNIKMKESAHVKIYTNHEQLDSTYKLTSGQRGVLFCLVKYMDRNNMVTTSKNLKRKIAAELGGVDGAIRNAISSLSKTQIIKRVEQGQYQVTPFLFSRTSWRENQKLREAWPNLKAVS